MGWWPNICSMYLPAVRAHTTTTITTTTRDGYHRKHTRCCSHPLGSECIIEKWRGKHDVMNQVLSGCFAGAAISAKSGPLMMCGGCAGFAAFSVAAEAIMGPH